MLKQLVLPVLLISMLGGCAVPTEEAGTVCIVRHRHLQSPELLQAIRAGIEDGGHAAKEVDAAAIPEDCGFCLYYGVQVENRKIRAVEFQGVRDGRALIKGSGPSDAEGNLTYAAVAAYAKAYMKEAEADAQERSHQKEAPGI